MNTEEFTILQAELHEAGWFLQQSETIITTSRVEITNLIDGFSSKPVAVHPPETTLTILGNENQDIGSLNLFLKPGKILIGKYKVVHYEVGSNPANLDTWMATLLIIDATIN
jgi:hypothetical protein